MSISKQFKSVSKRLMIIIVGLSIFSVGLLAFALYEANSISFDKNVNSQELYSVIEGNTAVEEYLESEKDYEAHFITIASLVKQEQQESLGKALLYVTLPVVIIAGAIGFVVAKYVLKPIRESYESQERFLQDAAHELRNPLAAMSLAIENNRDENKVESDFVKTIRRQTKRLVRINEDLLYLERRSAGNDIHEIDISNLLFDVIEDLQPSIVNKKISLNLDIDSGIKFKIDPNDYIKLTKNIIENSVKYSKHGGQINIELNQKNKIQFTVSDKGIGISENELKHIGERFYRAKNVSSIDGTGLGIAIVIKVLNTYGGDINVSSQINKGTTVKIRL